MLERRGAEVASALFKDVPPDPVAIGDCFLAVSPDEGRMYPHDAERTADRMTIRVSRCPLKDAWVDGGLPPRRIAALCRIAGAFDRGLFEAAGRLLLQRDLERRARWRMLLDHSRKAVATPFAGPLSRSGLLAGPEAANVREGQSREPSLMLKTTIAGSLPKPPWLAEPERLWAPWKMAGSELEQAKIDATILAVKLQEDAGIDIVGDGEQARVHFVHGFLANLDGIDFEQEDDHGHPQRPLQGGGSDRRGAAPAEGPGARGRGEGGPGAHQPAS